MASLFGATASRATSNPAGMLARKEQVMNEVRQQLALANAQQLITAMNERCYAGCITKPGPKLTPSDEGCLTRCSERFLEAFDLISKTYLKRLQTEREANQGGAVPMGGDGLR